jgi:phosphatidate cytidylyltransferase
VLRLRLLTAAVGLPLILLAIGAGTPTFGALLAVVAAVCAYELCRLAPGLRRGDPLIVLAVAWAAVLSVRYIVGTDEQFAVCITLPLVLSLLFMLRTGESRPEFAAWAWTIASAVYVGWLLGHWGGLYRMQEGTTLVLFGMLITFGYDTGAYFTGRRFGRHKLAPGISAGKTWEGVAGGVVLALCVGLLVRFLALRLGQPFPFPAGLTLAIAALLAVAAQLGDLVESALKRSANVKDAGGILPGHGGMLDRFDSLLFTGTMLYYVSLWTTM